MVYEVAAHELAGMAARWGDDVAVRDLEDRARNARTRQRVKWRTARKTAQVGERRTRSFWCTAGQPLRVHR